MPCEPYPETNPLGAGFEREYLSDTAAMKELGVRPSVFSSIRKRFSGGPAQAYAYLLFVLIYVPCIVAVSAMAREIGPGFAAFSVLYLTVLGWIVSTLFYQLTVGHQIMWILIPLALIGVMAGILYALGRERGEGTIPSRS